MVAHETRPTMLRVDCPPLQSRRPKPPCAQSGAGSAQTAHGSARTLGHNGQHRDVGASGLCKRRIGAHSCIVSFGILALTSGCEHSMRVCATRMLDTVAHGGWLGRYKQAHVRGPLMPAVLSSAGPMYRIMNSSKNSALQDCMVHSPAALAPSAHLHVEAVLELLALQADAGSRLPVRLAPAQAPLVSPSDRGLKAQFMASSR